MSPTVAVVMLLCVLANALGQVLLKKFALAHPTFTTLISLPETYSLFLPGLSLYVVGMVLWVGILRSTPLHIAFPVLGLAFVVVPVFSHFLLDEPVGWQTMLGGMVIMLGIWLSVRPA